MRGARARYSHMNSLNGSNVIVSIIHIFLYLLRKMQSIDKQNKKKMQARTQKLNDHRLRSGRTIETVHTLSFELVQVYKRDRRNR